MNYFALFNLPEEYSLNTELLEQRYQLLQRMTHPDKFASASVQEKRIYMQKNAEVNDGFRVLGSDVLRGEHLLSVRGTKLASEQETIGDTSFLMQQMDLRESLAGASSRADIEVLSREISEMLTDSISIVSSHISKNASNENSLAAIELNKLKFLKKLAEEIKQRLRSIPNNVSSNNPISNN